MYVHSYTTWDKGVAPQEHVIYSISEIIVVSQSTRKRGRCYPNHFEGSALVFVRRGGGGLGGGEWLDKHMIM